MLLPAKFVTFLLLLALVAGQGPGSGQTAPHPDDRKSRSNKYLFQANFFQDPPLVNMVELRKSSSPLDTLSSYLERFQYNLLNSMGEEQHPTGHLGRSARQIRSRPVEERLQSDTFGNPEQMQSRAVDTRVTFEVPEGEPKGTRVGKIPIKPGFTYRWGWFCHIHTEINTTAKRFLKHSTKF